LQNKLLSYQAHFDNLKKYHSFVDLQKIKITPHEYNQLDDILLFKTQEDLEALDYVLSSRRLRINEDADYRRYNIKTSFHNLHNVRIINPGKTFSFAHNVHKNAYVDDGKFYFTEGYAYLWSQGLVKVYAGWLCGGLTAFFQGLVSNQGFEILEKRNHTVWYDDLYSATIDGQEVTTWLSHSDRDELWRNLRRTRGKLYSCQGAR